MVIFYVVDSMARAAGLVEGYSDYSGLVGLALRMTRRGAALQEVQMHGCWKSLSMPARSLGARMRWRHLSGCLMVWTLNRMPRDEIREVHQYEAMSSRFCEELCGRNVWYSQKFLMVFGTAFASDGKNHSEPLKRPSLSANPLVRSDQRKDS